MNFGILMIQGLVNSFGTAVMAAFAAAVKIDSFAYMPVQDFGNAFSTFIAQNYGAGEGRRIHAGIRWRRGRRPGLLCGYLAAVCTSSPVPNGSSSSAPEETEILAVGVEYLRVEGACYCGIGTCFCSTACTGGWGGPGCPWC